MRPVIRYQSQLLYRKSYKPSRVIRIRPTAQPNVTFRPMRRFGLKPQPELVSYSKGVCTRPPLAQPAFHVGPNRCKSDHGCHALKV